MMDVRAASQRTIRERLAAAWSSLPALMKAGFVLLTVGGMADAAYHLFAGIHVEHLDRPGLIAHVTVLVGMVLALLGVLQAGVHSTRRSRRRRTIEGGNACLQ